MRGIECAFMASIGHDIELKTSKAGKPYASFSAVVQDEDVSQWLRIGCFGDTAEQLAGQAKRGDRVYVEGSLTLNTWEGADGEKKQGLNVAAWKCERLANIGHNRIRQERDPPSPSLPIVLPLKKKPKRPAFVLFRKPKPDASEIDPEFNDEVPF